jgi:hypothetical protein
MKTQTCNRNLSSNVQERAMCYMTARDAPMVVVLFALWWMPAVKSFSAAPLSMSVKTGVLGSRGRALRPGSDILALVHFKTRQRQTQCLVVDHKRAEPPARLSTEARPALRSLPGATEALPTLRSLPGATEDRTAGPGKDRPAGLPGLARIREISLDGRLFSRPWQLLEVAVALLVVAGYFSAVRSLTHFSGVHPTCIETITKSVCYLYMP